LNPQEARFVRIGFPDYRLQANDGDGPALQIELSLDWRTGAGTQGPPHELAALQVKDSHPIAETTSRATWRGHGRTLPSTRPRSRWPVHWWWTTWTAARRAVAEGLAWASHCVAFIERQIMQQC
jgi:hypothetical protein